ncbi:MAG: PDZ domain-containing protein [Phycisphaerae bacterium]|nr:PDZ domain-containing protein [Phycisphaerae bacterium]
MNTTQLTRLAPALLLAAAGAALASEPAPMPCMTGAHAARHDAAAPTIVAVRGEDSASEHEWSDGTNDVTITRKNGKVRVTLNGKEIMNLDDSELFQAEVADAREQAERAQVWAQRMSERARRGMAPMPPVPPGQTRIFGMAGETPKVMIGVTMETAEEASASLPDGFDPQKSTVITRVVKGLPAEKAGLKEGDVVIKINGSAAASPDDIRSAIKDKNAGDELTLRILRDGTEKDIVITLAAYDGAQLGSPRAWGFGGGQSSRAPEPMSDEDLKQLKELRAKMAATGAELEKMGAKLADTKDAEEREQLSERMAELGEQMAELGSQMGGITGHGNTWRFLSPGDATFGLQSLPRMRLERGNGGPPRAFVFTPDGQPAPADDDRIQKLDERLERLEKLLEKVAEQQEKNKN